MLPCTASHVGAPLYEELEGYKALDQIHPLPELMGAELPITSVAAADLRRLGGLLRLASASGP
jgi:hypothetical protein